jgi:hypothetical protein
MGVVRRNNGTELVEGLEMGVMRLRGLEVLLTEKRGRRV